MGQGLGTLVQGAVDLLIGLIHPVVFHVGPVGPAGLDEVCQAGVALEPRMLHRQGRHHGVAKAGPHGLRRGVHAFAQDIGNNLHPHRVLGAAAHSDNPVQLHLRMALHQGDLLGNGVAHGLQGAAVQVRSGVGQGQPEHHTPGLGVVHRRPLPGEVGQGDKALAAGGDGLHARHHGLVGVGTAVLLQGQGLGIEVVPVPLGEAAGGVGAGGDVAEAGDDELLPPQPLVVHQGLGTQDHVHRGPQLQHHLARLHHAGADSLGPGVVGAGDYRGALGKSRLRGGLGGDGPGEARRCPPPPSPWPAGRGGRWGRSTSPPAARSSGRRGG